MGSRVGRILQTLLGVEDMVAELPRTLEDIYVRLRAIEERLDHFRPTELPRAVCDNCKIDVILPDKNGDHALDYIQNIGWTVRDNMTLCPGCTRIRDGRGGHWAGHKAAIPIGFLRSEWNMILMRLLSNSVKPWPRHDPVIRQIVEQANLALGDPGDEGGEAATAELCNREHPATILSSHNGRVLRLARYGGGVYLEWLLDGALIYSEAFTNVTKIAERLELRGKGGANGAVG